MLERADRLVARIAGARVSDPAAVRVDVRRGGMIGVSARCGLD